MLTDVHIHKLSPDTFELRIDRFTYTLSLKQVLDLYNSIHNLLDNKAPLTERPSELEATVKPKTG